MEPDLEGPARQRRRKAHMMCDKYGFVREDRLELARVLLWRDVESWTDLDDAEISRLLDALEGFAFVHWLMTNRVQAAGS
jgi:hypothetical protein